MSDRIEDVWGTRTPHARGTAWPERVDSHLAEGLSDTDVDRWVRSGCVLCSYGCGVDIAVKDERIVGVRGRADDHVNHGRLGPKGLFGWQANNSPDRLTRPLVRTNGTLEESDWDTAMSIVVDRSKQLLADRGPATFGFYTSGQLFLEEYYAQAIVARAGIGTAHLDGNTRLCTATAASALKESFGCDGDPGCYEDLDECDTLFMVGHNVAETQTVMWARVLDRLHGPDRPRLVVVDPRETPTAREADVHLRIANGTNLALLNAIQHELIRTGRVDEAFVRDHTVGFEELKNTVEGYPPERAAEICGLDAEDIRRAAEIIGQAEALVSTALQGAYQSNQATASAVQINNINLLRGMIGKPGATVFQMNGQPTAQNTRETGANGDLPGFRNWANPAHVADLASHWNVDELTIPHWGPPTHAMQIFRYAEEGSIRFLWVTCTNPAVSMPELHRMREILAQERLFLVVQDAFLTETAEMADVVLPAAMWGEKTGTFTNADRTVHLSDKAVEPPGEARADFDIFMEYARRMEFRDKDGAPLIPWTNPEDAFEAFKSMTAGRPVDYTGLSYERLREGSLQWPCPSSDGESRPRLYTDHVFQTFTEHTEDYGHDLLTGAQMEEADHRAVRADGRAILKAAEFVPPREAPSDDYPFRLGTGRRVYHFHTRTKTGRAPELQAAAPEVWVELNEADAESLGIAEGDLCAVTSSRGCVVAPARIGGIRQGAVFVPFHYGYWDADGDTARDHTRAANELTITQWDPVSKQPIFKTAAVRVEKA
ncbi:MAG: molybdopterin oxidoreductase family protein [Actinomycetota bacterium]